MRSIAALLLTVVVAGPALAGGPTAVPTEPVICGTGARDRGVFRLVGLLRRWPGLAIVTLLQIGQALTAAAFLALSTAVIVGISASSSSAPSLTATPWT